MVKKNYLVEFCGFFFLQFCVYLWPGDTGDLGRVVCPVALFATLNGTWFWVLVISDVEVSSFCLVACLLFLRLSFLIFSTQFFAYFVSGPLAHTFFVRDPFRGFRGEMSRRYLFSDICDLGFCVRLRMGAAFRRGFRGEMCQRRFVLCYI